MAKGLVKQFRISTRWSGRFRTVQICVYEDAKSMREAGRKHARHYSPEVTQGFDKAFGLSQSYDLYTVSAGGRVKRYPSAGFIRLIKGDLEVGLLSHECTHMAVAIYKQDIQKTIPDMEREEKLCYLTGHLMSQVVKALYKHKLLEQ